MKVTRRSPLSGMETTLDLPITDEQLARWRAGELIQNVMPHLAPAQREFLITGYTEQDWGRMFSGDDDED